METPEYLDSAATTRVDSRVVDLMVRLMTEGQGNAGSRTHQFGTQARSVVEAARAHVAAVVEADEDEVIFTSGATEANNLTILGLAPHAEAVGRRHVVVSAIEHKAVLEPAEFLTGLGFEVSVVGALSTGTIDPDELASVLRPETLLVSIMHVNNETGVIQPVDMVADLLAERDTYLHVDAAQGFGKELGLLRNKRIDLISISGHKLYAPQGTGALITRKRSGGERPPLRSLVFGGGQERGLRPGTVSVPLTAALGEAARLALAEHSARSQRVEELESEALEFIERAGGTVNGDRSLSLPHIINASFRGLDSEAFIVATKQLVAVSNGAACSSHSYQRSHVLEAMHLEPWRVAGGVRFSFSHESSAPNWRELARLVESVRF